MIGSIPYAIGIPVVLTVYMGICILMLRVMGLSQDPQKSLIGLASAGFMGVLLVWIADKIVGVNAALLTEAESNHILAWAQNILLIIVGYFFGSKDKPPEDKL